MKKIKKILKENSLYLIILTLFEFILNIISTLAFVYSDSLNYNDSLIYQSLGVQKLLETLYSSTYWALILLLLSFISIFSFTTLVYKKLEFQFISIMCWFQMFIIALNLKNSIQINLSICLLFIPILIINIICYKKEKEYLIKHKK